MWISALFRALGFGKPAPPPPVAEEHELAQDERDAISSAVQRSMRRAFIDRVKWRN